MMRAHGTGTPREIWRFGEPGTPWYDALAKIIRLRSRLVPHLYSLAALYSEKGLPMVRVPALVFTADPRTRRRDDEMLLGDAVLVRPVTRPTEYLPEGKRAEPADDLADVYLPAGTDWYAWESAERFRGGQTLRVHAPLDTVPLYVRAGGIVLTGPVRQYTDENPAAPLTVTVYPGADGTFVWYEDAGDGYGYEQGERARVTLRWDDARRRFTASARDGRYPGMPEKRELTVRIPGRAEQTLVYDGNACRADF